MLGFWLLVVCLFVFFFFLGAKLVVCYVIHKLGYHYCFVVSSTVQSGEDWQLCGIRKSMEVRTTEVANGRF